MSGHPLRRLRNHLADTLRRYAADYATQHPAPTSRRTKP